MNESESDYDFDDARAAIRELSTTLAILAGACLLAALGFVYLPLDIMP